ncbi:transglutaminase-like domain-containing protein [Pseudomonas pseudonitroreducens]|uniref:transglutaminase-like domain-containing protein n=1 Tax=Pseudomonas pseudonitroreducens TaxID=2892326 RepID=UPI001F45E632|nr:transglutaminase-like domain-containing protein [Pseudomonas pseudonitroreducens]
MTSAVQGVLQRTVIRPAKLLACTLPGALFPKEQHGLDFPELKTKRWQLSISRCYQVDIFSKELDMPVPLQDKALFDRITLANRVIAVVQALLGNTPLNRRGRLNNIDKLTVDVLGDMQVFYQVIEVRNYLYGRSNTNRTQAARQRHEQRVQNGQIRRTYDPSNPAHRPNVVMGSLSVEGRKGMCQEYASLTYALLRHLLPATDQVCYVYEADIKHFFCTIGDHDQRAANPLGLIVVDSWYTWAEAVLWEHSSHKASQYGGSAIYCKPGKGDDNFLNKEVNTALALRLIAESRHGYVGRKAEVNFNAEIQGLVNSVDRLPKSNETLHIHDRNQYPGHMSTFAKSDTYVGYTYINPTQ